MMFKKNNQIISVFILFLLFNMLFIASVNGNVFEVTTLDGYTDITVDEAWDLLSNTSNGIQIPIDVRSDSEWIGEHIDTPYPENPRHHNFYDWDDSNVLQNFLSKYQGKEIIVYCRSGGRSASAVNILVDNGFSGTIYNMLGGITAWKSENYPTVANRAPEKPSISGPAIGQINTEYNFLVNTTDPDMDEIYYCVDWDDGTNEQCFGPFSSGEETVLSHIWIKKGLHYIIVKAKDVYDAESQESVFDFDISATELSINSIQGSLLSVSVEIENTGENIAENISTVIQVKGGIFSRINLTHNCSGCIDCGTTLPPGEIKTENTGESGLLFGFGSIEITVSTWADNAEKITTTRQGTILGIFIQI
jgi:rhodanese-related sulfurtransferase